MAYSAADVRRIHQDHRIASLIGIEGGHQINNSLAVLRQMYDLGARYMTLTHSLTIGWADSATDVPRHQGLTPFGIDVIHEMNRLGMMVDLSHVSPDVMRMALKESKAPVIFSHSSARSLVDHPRNVPDDVLRAVATNGGVVMVNFAPSYVSDEVRRWEADRARGAGALQRPPFGGLYIGQPERAKAALAAWDRRIRHRSHARAGRRPRRAHPRGRRRRSRRPRLRLRRRAGSAASGSRAWTASRPCSPNSCAAAGRMRTSRSSRAGTCCA